jgi:hypothetical protein
MFVLLTALFANPAHAGPASYRHIEDGVGNCIWATHSLPKDQESTYADVRQKFTSPEKVIEHRCYYPARLDELLKEGRLENSMRDSGKYWSQYILTGPGGELDQLVNIRQPWDYSSGVASFDQTRAILDPASGQCVTKTSDSKAAAPNGCLDIEKALRSAAKGKFPYTGNLCLDIFFEKADEAALNGAPIRVVRKISAGCMAYTVTK